METKNLTMLVTIVIITILIGISLALGISNINLNNTLSLKNDELDVTQNKLNDNITKFKETSASLNQTTMFFNTYLNGLGSYYNATLIQEKSGYRLNQARVRYDDGHWSNALAWYWDASDWYHDAWEKFNETKEIFDNATSYKINSTYSDICLIYSDIMDASCNAMVYCYEAADLYANACEFYLSNDYNAAHESYDTAELKMSYHDDEIEKVEGHQEDLNILLSQIS